jgi:hypothetical protein
MPTFSCSPAEVQAVKDALRRNPHNGGIGIVHEPTRSIHLIPFDDLPDQGGHVTFATGLGFDLSDCKGFGIMVDPSGQPSPINASQLNGLQGASGSHQMPPATFADVVLALQAAGL